MYRLPYLTCLLTFAFVSVSFAQSPYTITDLGTLADCGSAGYAINARGQVTGLSQRRALLEGHLWCVGPWDTFLISSPYTTMTDLGTLGRYNGHEASWVSGINSSGQVVGFSYSIYHLPSDPAWPSRHAFVISPPYTNMIDLGTLPGGDSGSSASGINDAGQITGTSFGQTS